MFQSRHRSLPLAVLLLCLLVTVTVTWALERAERMRERAALDAEVSGIVSAVQARMGSQLTLLRGVGGFVRATPQMNGEQFRDYVERLRLDQHYPGVLGVGFAEFARSRAEMSGISSRAAAGGVPGFHHWPDGERSGYSAILYLEPLNRLNRAAIGFDMMSEPVRRRAMAQSVRSDLIQLSGRVRLVQEIEPEKQPGFLLYLPVYEGDRSGWDQLRGWAYSPLRAHDFFSAVFASHAIDDSLVEIFDGSASEENLLFRSGESRARAGAAATVPLEVAGRQWVIRVTSPGGRAMLSPSGLVALAAGTVISLLLALLLNQQIRFRARVERQVVERTEELSRASERLVAEAEARRAAEEQLSQAQKMEAVGQLTGGIAHDFNNLLTVIRGSADLLMSPTLSEEKRRRYIAAISETADRAANLTNQLLAFARRQPLQPVLFDVAEKIVRTTDMLRTLVGERIRINLQLDCPDCFVEADPVQFETALVNLAVNARDAMDGTGVLTIGVTNKETSGKPGPVRVSVSDEGVGIPPEAINRLFEPFFTTKAPGEGTGLGLSQVYGFVKQSGGDVTVESRVGEGTTICLVLPRREPPSDVAEAAGSPNAVVRGGGRVLIVEDNAEVRAFAANALAELGYETTLASDGDAALELLEREQGGFDLVFTDVMMPGTDGVQLAEAITERLGIPVVLTSGYSAILASGTPSGYQLLRKPYTIADLSTAISKARAPTGAKRA